MAFGMMAKQMPRGTVAAMRVYVGTYTDPILFGTGEVFQGKGKGIYCYDLDPSTGQLAHVGTTTGVTNPSYLALDPAQRLLYAVNELKTFENEATGTLSSFSVDSATGGLTFINKKPTGGTDPCHVTMSRDGRLVFAANFMSGSVCVFSVARDGGLEKATDFVQHVGSSVDPKRQNGPHAHSTVLDSTGTFALVPDLGLDKVMVYRVDSLHSKLEPAGHPWAASKPGAGPRLVVFHPSRRFVYLINELDCTIAAYSFNPKTAEMKALQIVSTLPSGYSGPNSCADLQIHPSGTWLYGSNRGHDSIVMYKVNGQTGKLDCVGHEPTQGRNPRSFSIDPTGTFLVAANQTSSNLVPFRVDPKTGSLKATGTAVEVPTPVCVKILAPYAPL
jgi:6-phosphogluconolactonase